ncbi:MAG: hypothetical protein DWQ07_14880 [Chloroflexi bacterium]|nr:MAG: hypothetical protein DWQ07_14880 [Chloroflexota bacterium]MBL1195633.1 hypothetical protein [Chloroflexota bacterium]NOH12921.1 hypothetical protein [Chloroflexota bacterium]
MKINKSLLRPVFFAILSSLLFACNLSSPSTPAVAESAPEVSDTPIPAATATPEPSATVTLTETPLPTETATETLTPTALPTLGPVEGKVNVERANCRYGPGPGYLYEYGFVQDLPVEVLGRTPNGEWVFVQGLWYQSGCWMKTELLALPDIDIMRVGEYYGVLPYSEYYPPPQLAGVSREEDTVTVAWIDVGMTEDKYRGYLIEAWVCIDGQIEFSPVNIDGTITNFTDEAGCSSPSYARIFSSEKHGYSYWREIPWPQHPDNPEFDVTPVIPTPYIHPGENMVENTPLPPTDEPSGNSTSP